MSLTYSTTRAGSQFTATLGVVGATAYETVEIEGADDPVHAAEFPVSHLGSASRDEYLRVMTESVIDARQRALRPAPATRPA